MATFASVGSLSDFVGITDLNSQGCVEGKDAAVARNHVYIYIYIHIYVIYNYIILYIYIYT